MVVEIFRQDDSRRTVGLTEEGEAGKELVRGPGRRRKNLELDKRKGSRKRLEERPYIDKDLETEVWKSVSCSKNTLVETERSKREK